MPLTLEEKGREAMNRYNDRFVAPTTSNVRTGLAEALEELDRVIKQVDECSVALQEKVNAFLLPEPPGAIEKTPSDPVPMRSDAANALFDKAAKVGAAAARLRSVLNRLDF